MLIIVLVAAGATAGAAGAAAAASSAAAAAGAAAAVVVADVVRKGCWVAEMTASSRSRFSCGHAQGRGCTSPQCFLRTHRNVS